MIVHQRRVKLHEVKRTAAWVMLSPNANTDNGIEENATGGAQVAPSKLSCSDTLYYKKHQSQNA